MNGSASAYRMTENEVIFRQHNERVQKGLEKLFNDTKNEDRDLLGDTNDIPLHFMCECSDENCQKRIIMKPSKYKKLHKTSSHFIILPGHGVASIERIVHEEPDYMVVEKYLTPPKKAKRLNKTDVDNT